MSIVVKTVGLEDFLEGGTGKIKVLLAGPPGAGKTRMSSFAPKPIYANVEDGLLSVADRQVPYADTKTEAAMDAFLAYLEAECRKPPAQRRWETVVVDTIDAYERHWTQEYLRARGKGEMEGWEDWGALKAEMNGLITRLMALPMNVIVLAHTKDVTRDGQVPKDQKVLRLSGDTRDALPADFDFVGLFEVERGIVDGQPNDVRKIRWKATPSVPWLKFRGGAIETTLVDFTAEDFGRVRNVIAGTLQQIEAAKVIDQIPVSGETVQGEVVRPVQPGPGTALPVAKSATPPPPPPVVPQAAPPAPAPQPTPPPAVPAAPPSSVPDAPPVVTPPPAVPKPDLTPPVSDEQAVENVRQGLGGQVVSDSAGIIPSEVQPEEQGPGDMEADNADAAGEASSAQQGAETPVAEPQLPVDSEAAPADDQPPVDQAGESVQIPDDGTVTVLCGDPRYAGTDPVGRVPGCRKPLNVTLESGRIVAVEGEIAQLMEMAGIKERAFLCNADFNKARQAANQPTT